MNKTTSSAKNREYETLETRIVTKRDGKYEILDICKIRKIVEWACQGTDINPYELEASLNETLKNKVSTQKIQQNLIYHAYKKINLEYPDWRLVAGRLLLSEIRKTIALKRQINAIAPYQFFHDHVTDYVNKGFYNPLLIQAYTKEELKKASSMIVGEYDLNYDYASLYTLRTRYLVKDELPQELFMTNALILASKEKKEIRMKLVGKYYELLATRKISLATPLLKNMRSKNGSLTSCFILQLDDDLDELFRTFHRVARISKVGGGVGIYASYIRANGAPVMNQKNASGGILPWVKILNDIAVAVNQVGARSGAITIALDIWHYDILELLDCQTENGDTRKKTYDIFPQVVLNDLFLERVENNQDWYIVDPYEVKNLLGIDLPPLWGKDFVKAYKIIEQSITEGIITRYRKINAKSIMKTIMRVQLETGLPYIAFKDTINKANPNKHLGFIPCTNLCTESYSNVSHDQEHCCNLASLNLAQLVDASSKELEEVCRYTVKILDTSIDLTNTPNPQAKKHNELYRTIGVGAMGLADWLAYKKFSFEDTNIIENLFEDISLYCTEASVSLAKEKGAYTAFKDSEWNKGFLINCRSLEDVLNSAQSKNFERWKDLAQNIQNFGIRNSQIMAIAPNTSSSLIMEATASILPVFSKIHDFTNDLGSIPIVPPFLKDRLWYYAENKYLNQEIVINVVSAIQKWVDTGISMELIFNLNEGVYHGKEKAITAADIYKMYMKAWKQGCKAIYYIRSVDKILKEGGKDKAECSSCSG